VKRFLAAGVLALLLATPVAAGEERDLYNRGLDAAFSEKWADARDVFRDFIRQHPDSVYSDDAHYWLGMALYELEDPGRAYETLKEMTAAYPDSPWSDDGRLLMVKCAMAALKQAAGNGPQRGSASLRTAPAPTPAMLAEYRDFIDMSTDDSSSKVQLFAIDSVLGTNPEKAPELLPKLSSGGSSPEATEMVLDRFFSGQDVMVTVGNPTLGWTDGNIHVMVRRGGQVDYLGLSEAIRLVDSGPSARFDEPMLKDIRAKLLDVERGLVREGEPASLELPSSGDGKSMSTIVKVIDGEVHYYRNPSETTRVVVLNRHAGFKADNIRVFVETRSGTREIPLAEARRMVEGTASAQGLSDATVRYLKAALAIIEIDLSREAGN